MSPEIVPAIVAAIAALGGVTLGAIVEPLKLGAARRAQGRTDRAARCAALIEAAMSCRARLLNLNLAHRQLAAGEALAGASVEERLEDYRTVRNVLRQTVALIILSGPDALADAAMTVREADRYLRSRRFVLDAGGTCDHDKPPDEVLDGARRLEQSIHSFAATARRYAR